MKDELRGDAAKVTASEQTTNAAELRQREQKIAGTRRRLKKRREEIRAEERELEKQRSRIEQLDFNLTRRRQRLDERSLELATREEVVKKQELAQVQWIDRMYETLTTIFGE
jgi:uncharacterized protein (DUF3084 family)